MPIFQRAVEASRDLCPTVLATCRYVCPLGIRSSRARQLRYPWGYQGGRNGKHPRCLWVTVRFVDERRASALTDTRFDVPIGKTACVQGVVNILTSCHHPLERPSALARTITHLADRCYKCPNPSSPSYLSKSGQSCPLAGQPTQCFVLFHTCVTSRHLTCGITTC
jgi:hypothetical protein